MSEWVCAYDKLPDKGKTVLLLIVNRTGGAFFEIGSFHSQNDGEMHWKINSRRWTSDIPFKPVDFSEEVVY